MKLKDIMIADVKSCAPDALLDSVALAMWHNDCGAVPIVDGEGHPVGIVTDRDIAMGSAIQHKPLWEMCSRDVAQSRPLYTCETGDDIHAALDLMRKQQIRRLPVVDKEGKLAGIVSMGDIVAHAGERAHRKTDISGESALDMMKAVVHH